MQYYAKQTLIAVVDDDSAVRRALQRLLAASGFLVATFACGGDFLRTVPVIQPDCLLLDLHLPDAPGLEVLRQLNEMQAHFPTIVISADNQSGISQRTTKAGAAAFLSKPVEEGALLCAIRRALNHPTEGMVGEA